MPRRRRQLESSGEESVELPPRLFALRLGHDLQVDPKLHQDLPTGSARGSRLVSQRREGKPPELPVSMRNRSRDGVAFGTDGQTVRSILDVAADEDLASARFEGSPYREPGVGRVGPLTGCAGQRQQLVVSHGCLRCSGAGVRTVQSRIQTRGSRDVHPVRIS
jgi:hypothetical protein